MPRRLWRSLDGPYVAARPGDTVDLRGTTRSSAVAERKEILLQSYYSGVGSYFGGYNTVTTVPGRPWTLDRGVREGYARVVWVYRAVRVIALSQSRLRFGVKDSDKPVGMGATELYDDPLIPKLNVRSNPIEFSYQFRERVSTQWHLSPRGGFIETVQFARRRGTSELRLLPAGRTRIVPDKGGNIDHFEVDPVGGVGKPRPIAPELVRWFREPHPTDPFSGMTPLEAAGLSIEMDHFARLFNRQSMANDGRPGGIVAVTSPDGKGEPADDAELDRIERKFAGGPMDAGRLVVIDGTVTYEDVSRSPRDLQWAQARTAGRDEIFVAFGVPVSVAGDSSDRTFSNAGQEWIDFWTLTGVTHGDAFAWLFHDDVEGVPFLDYSKVRALQVLAEQQRAEWRDETQQGLRTPLRYAMDTGQPVGDGPGEFPDVPATRALWFPGSGRVPIAQNDDDQEAVDKLAPLGSGTQGAPLQEGAPGDQGGQGGGDQGGGGGGGDFGGGDGGGGGQGGDPLAKQLVPHHAGDSNLASIAVKRAARRRQAAAAGARARARRDHGDDDQEDHRADAAATALEAHMTALANRLVGVTVARVQGVKARMGTRHWIPKPGEPVSVKQLDAEDVVDPQAWYDQAEQVARDNLGPVAQQQYDTTAGQVGEDGGADITALLVAGATATALGVGPTLLAAELAAATAWLATSAANHAAELLAVIQRTEADDAARVAAGGAPLGVQPVVDAIREWAKGIPGWIQQVAPTSAAQAVEAGKHAALTPLGDRVERVWRTKRDDKVRAAHKLAEGQVAKAGKPFVVDAEELRYPRDPKGSPGNVINCRCRTRWRLAAKATEGTGGGDVVAKVLAMPMPSTKALVHPSVDAMLDEAGVRLPRGARVLGGGALAGVEDRDHVAEMLGAVTEEKRRERHVRTPEGSRLFHEPIGAAIVAHPGLRGIGGRDHVAEITKPDAAAAARAELAQRLGDAHARMGGGMPSGDAAAVPQLPRTGRTTPLPNGTRAVHQDGTVGRVEHVRVAELRAGDRLVNPVTGAHAGTVTSVRHGDGFGKEVTDKTPLGVDRRVDVDGELHGTFTPQKTFTRHVPESEPLPATEGSPGDMAKAKAELEEKGQTVLALIDKGMDPADAEKEYARLLHNARFRYRRDRLKAEKAAGGKVEKAVADDTAQGPKETTLAGIGQQLLDAPEDVKLDLALGKEAGVQPKALYSLAGTTGPGAVGATEKWYDKLTADTDAPIPVSNLHVESGYFVAHGVAVRKNGVSYLVETAGPEPTDAELARLANAGTVYENVLGAVGERRSLQRGVAIVAGHNPRDAYWAEKYATPGFVSAATGGLGGTVWWGSTVNPATAAHEFGHNLDSGAHLPDVWVSQAHSAVVDGQPQSWLSATTDDGRTAAPFAPGGELHGKFHETRASGHPITPGQPAVTGYGAKDPKEDFAESVRLYLKDRREGKLGYLDPEPGQTLGTNVRFADLWPARARQMDAMFGLTSDYDTPFAQQRLDKATAAALGSRVAVHEALQEQGHVPESLGLDELMAFGLSMQKAAKAWEDADTAFKAHLHEKNTGDALEHVKEQWTLSGEVPEPAVQAEMVATLVDGFELSHADATAIVADAAAWKAGQLELAAQQKASGEAKLAAEQAVQNVLSLADLPKEIQTVIRKRRANVKLRAKQKGATAEQAEAIAAAYEAEQVAKESKKLGIQGVEPVKVKVAKDVGASAVGPEVRVLPTAPKGKKTAGSAFLTKAGTEVAPHAGDWLNKYGSSGKRQQAKANIAATLAAALNNEQDWQTFRTYRNSGASKGVKGQMETLGPGELVKSFDAYSPQQRQELLDAEMSMRIQMWASTSGDSNPFAVMMQQAIKDELGVPGPVGVNSGGSDTLQKDIEARYPKVQEFYRRFVRLQYEHTQAELEKAGIEWVQVYRGMKIPKGTHAWADDLDDVHVPLQPASSFATSSSTAQTFAGSGMVMRGTVHRSMVLGCARTGFGCLNETEYVVLAPVEGQAQWRVRYRSKYSKLKKGELDALFDTPVGTTAATPPWGDSQPALTSWSVAMLNNWWHATAAPEHAEWRKKLLKEFVRRGVMTPADK